jgi:hypothetical protein
MGRLRRGCSLCLKRRAAFLTPEFGNICKFCWNERFNGARTTEPVTQRASADGPADADAAPSPRRSVDDIEAP